MGSVTELIKSFDSITTKQKAGNPKGLYIIGGRPSTVAGRSLERYDADTETWERCSNMSEVRSSFAAVLQNGVVYVLGGRDKANNQLKTIDTYSPATDSWKRLEITLLTPRSEFGVAVDGSHIYSVGGYGEASNTIECFNTAQNVVTPRPKFNQSRWGLGVVICRKKIYVIGGHWYDWRNPNMTSTVGSYYNAVEVFDVGSWTWSTGEGMLRRRGYHAVTTYDDTYIYAFGGVGGETGRTCNRLQESVERFDVRSQQWTLIQPMPLGVSNMAAAVFQKKILILGGIDIERRDMMKRKRDEVYEYDPDENECGIRDALKLSRVRFSFAVVLV